MIACMEHFIPIGQFAAMTRLTLKALRHYGETGLLLPASIDPTTGYRYYRLDQVGRARLIRLLRAADVPLAEIRLILDGSGVALIDAYVRDLEARQADRLRVLRFVRQMIDQESAGSEMTHVVSIKEVAAQPYLGRSEVISIKRLEGFITESIQELSARTTPAGPPFAVFHDPVNDEAEGRIEVGVPTADAQPGGDELPAGLVASTVVEGTQTDYPEILGAYDAVADWVKHHGHELTGPPREIYLASVAGGEQAKMEIAWPIR